MNKKKTVCAVLLAVLILTAAIMVGNGFTKNNYVRLGDFTISGDGTEMRFTIYTNSSMSGRHIRGYDDAGDGNQAHYLNFYNTFGFDFPWGAKTEYVLTLDENDREIHFNRINGGYELVLIRDGEGGTWRRPIADP